MNREPTMPCVLTPAESGVGWYFIVCPVLDRLVVDTEHGAENAPAPWIAVFDLFGAGYPCGTGDTEEAAVRDLCEKFAAILRGDLSTFIAKWAEGVRVMADRVAEDDEEDGFADRAEELGGHADLLAFVAKLLRAAAVVRESTSLHPTEETTEQYVERLEREHAARGEPPIQPGHFIHDPEDEDPEVDDGPVVCGGCYAVGAEPHAHDCADERIRLDQEERIERGEIFLNLIVNGKVDDKLGPFLDLEVELRKEIIEGEYIGMTTTYFDDVFKGCSLKARMDEWPEDLRVQEFPED